MYAAAAAVVEDDSYPQLTTLQTHNSQLKFLLSHHSNYPQKFE